MQQMLIISVNSFDTHTNKKNVEVEPSEGVYTNVRHTFKSGDRSVDRFLKQKKRGSNKNIGPPDTHKNTKVCPKEASRGVYTNVTHILKSGDRSVDRFLKHKKNESNKTISPPGTHTNKTNMSK